MSPSPPPAPPLPPPTVPSQPRPETPSPPPASRPPAARQQIFEQPTAPFPSSRSSLEAIPQSDYDPDAVDDLPTSDDDDRSAHSSRSKASKPARARRRLRCFPPHSLPEAGNSLWLPTTVLLLFRLAVAAMLIGHAVFYSLAGVFSFRLYATWAYIGLALAFLGAVTCSLLQLIRDGDDDESDIADEEEGGHPADALLGLEERNRGFGFVVAQTTVPLYQVFVTVTVFGAIIFWAAILPEQSADISYPLLALNAVAPAVAVIDMLLSLSMQFRLVYVLLVVLFNAAYAATLYAFYKLDDIYVYNFLDPAQPKGEFAAKAAGLGVASIVAALFLYALSLIRDMIVRRREQKDKASEADTKSVSDKDVGSESEETSESSKGVQKEAEHETEKQQGVVHEVSKEKEETSHEFDVDEVVIADSDEENSDFSSRLVDKRDRGSIPISNRPSCVNTAGSGKRWYRSSASGQMQTSLSVTTLDEEEPELRTMSQWDDLDLYGVHAKPQDEYFTMPAAYNGGKEDVVKLTPIMRSGSGRQFARSGSGRQLFRSGSGRQFVRSSSGRALARASSGGSIRQSGTGSRPSPRMSNTVLRASGEAVKHGNDQTPV